ncbi:MAG: hypothetical protein NZ988_03060 [Thaumarchaeota archaeon]|nr:hypothetical protein [Candidatus Calditenuaceae archaeon]MDW8187010.1 hypothetical protein [Nitrososphaerota archaeon]
MSGLLRLSEALEVARRIAVMNFFDGVMVGTGLVLGLALSSAATLKVVLVTVASVTFGSSVSGFMGAWLAESVEQQSRLRKLEEALLSDLKGTIHHEAAVTAPFLVGIINAAAAASGVILVSSPYLIVAQAAIDPLQGVLASMAVSLASLTGVGRAVERYLRLRPAYAATRFLISGVVMMLVIVAVDMLIAA